MRLIFNNRLKNRSIFYTKHDENYYEDSHNDIFYESIGAYENCDSSFYRAISVYDAHIDIRIRAELSKRRSPLFTTVLSHIIHRNDGIFCAYDFSTNQRTSLNKHSEDDRELLF